MASHSTELITGDGRKITVSDVVQLYRNTVNLSSPARGIIHKLTSSIYSLEARFNVTDCDMMDTIKTQKIYSLQMNPQDHTIDSVQCLSGPNDLTELASIKSKNGQYLARLKGASTGASSKLRDVGAQARDATPIESKRQILEIWDRSRLIKTLDINELDAHGTINTDPQFAKMIWSNTGRQDKLLYVCQPKKPKPLSFFKEPGAKSPLPSEFLINGASSSSPQSSNSSVKSTDGFCSRAPRGDEYNAKEDWGESLSGIEHTILAILDVSDQSNFKITTIEEEGISLGEPIWLENCTKVASVGWMENPRRLGLVYCNNRPSSIYVHDCNQPAADKRHLVLKLGQDGKCYHSIRVNNAGDKFLYLVNDAFGAHRHSNEMYLYDFINRTSRKCIAQNTSTDDFIEPKTSTNKERFFINDLPDNCFTSDDKNILLVTFDHLYQILQIYNLESKTLHKIDFPTISVSILDFNYDIILAVGSAVNTTPTMFVAKLNLSNTHDILPWHQIEDCHHLDDISYDTYIFPTSDKKSIVTSILVSPVLPMGQTQQEISESSKCNNSIPTVVLAHGGPHASFQVTYMITPILYARLGLRTLLINYRGSPGVDQDYITTLCGNVGEMDVDDVLQAVRCAVDKKLIQRDKLVVNGGSHGGFIACHLSCQDEFKFTSALIRNPVTDIASMYTVTDIPDWTFNEALGHTNFDFSWVPGTEELTKMFICSPVSRMDKANVPTLMLLGNKDRRVPMSQGLRWHETLKAKGVESKCKIYNDKHDLARPEVAADSFVTSAIWILNHLPNKQ